MSESTLITLKKQQSKAELHGQEWCSLQNQINQTQKKIDILLAELRQARDEIVKDWKVIAAICNELVELQGVPF